MTDSFGDRLTRAIRKFGPLCVGLDPHPDLIPDFFGEGLVGIGNFFAQILQSTHGKVGVVKPQIALFERYGPDGLAILADICKQAKASGQLVLLDAKRGDIGSTAAGYAEAYLGPDAWLDVDAITLNPYMGTETLEPFFEMASDQNKGVIVLTRTSNPGAADFQEQTINGIPLYEIVAEKLAPFARDMVLGSDIWSSLMVVVGANAPVEAKRLRSILPHCPFLVPGYGAQGASAAEALSASVNGEGVVVNASRSVLFPQEAHKLCEEEPWQLLFDQNLQNIISDLAEGL